MVPPTDTASGPWHPGAVRYSEFEELAVEVFGPQVGRALLADQVLGALQDRTAREALADGEEPRQVWRALCDAMGVPERERWGADLRGRGSRR